MPGLQFNFNTDSSSVLSRISPLAYWIEWTNVRENAKFEYCSEVLLACATFSKDHSIPAFTTKRLFLYLIKKNGENTHQRTVLGSSYCTRSSMYIDTLCLASLDMQHSCHKDAPVRTDHLRKKARLKSRKVSCDLRKFSCFSSVRRLL